MKTIAVNGSPRKTWNTASLLKKALEGAAAAGAETKLIHLYDLNYQGCTSCFSCKQKNSKLHKQCAMKDDLTDVLNEIIAGDVLLLGSPIYLGDITGEMRSFFERLVFPNLSYDKTGLSGFRGKISTGFIYTMNITEDMLESYGYEYLFDSNRRYTQIFNGSSEYFISTDTYQFDDYSKYDAPRFNEKHKAQVRAERFPLDCDRAFDMGFRLSANAKEIS